MRQKPSPGADPAKILRGAGRGLRDNMIINALAASPSPSPADEKKKKESEDEKNAFDDLSDSDSDEEEDSEEEEGFLELFPGDRVKTKGME